MIRRLRFKFVAINMAFATVMLAAMLVLVYYSTAANLENDSINMLRSAAISPLLPAPGEAAGDIKLPFFTVLLGPDGAVTETYGGYFDLTDRETLRALVEEALSSASGIGVMEDNALRYYRAELPGRLSIVFGDISSEMATLSGLTRTCAIVGVLGFLAFLSISAALSRWAVRPVERAWQEQKEFVAAASHELRTPLTAILTNAELAPPVRAVENIRAAARPMKALTEQLLTLARAENEGERVPEVCDLSRALGETVLEFEPLCFEQGKTLEADIAPGVRVRGDAVALGGLGRIFLDNAVKYARPGGRISVSLQAAGRRKCRLVVADEGEPIAKEELELIFRRFYRSPGVRSLPGFGLGLSIAAATAARAHGRVWCESADGVNRFITELPRLP